MSKRIYKLVIAMTTAVIMSGCTIFSQPHKHLEVQVYNPQQASIFPVTSSLVIGQSEVVLIDAQFQKNDAERLVNMVRQTGKTLTTIYISHGDPDYYFGLDVITAAFPNAKVVATPATVEKIEKSMQGKLAYWGPILKDNAPQSLVLPQALMTDTLLVDGEPLKIIGFDGHDPKHTFIWLDALNTVLGGVVLTENMHLWMADNKTQASRSDWLKTLKIMSALEPQRVIAGHFLGKSKENQSIIDFTSDYIQAFERANSDSNTAAALSKTVKEKYPALLSEDTLEFSAKVVKGDIQWPQ